MDRPTENDLQDVVRKQRKNSLFISSAGTFQFLAGILSATGLAITLPLLIGAKATATTAATGLAADLGFGAAIAGLTASTAGVAGLILLAAAAVATGVAVASHYIASRSFQSANFGALEINAKHTAQYLANEIKQSSQCLANEHDQAKRADGKSWQQYHADRACADAAISR